jgi:hypothetical protein
MNIKFILLTLLLIKPIISTGATKGSTITGENSMAKPNFTNRLTPPEREELMTTIKIAIRVLNDNNLLEEQKESKFFDSFSYKYPKNGPIDKVSLTKNLFLKLNLTKNNKDGIAWNSGNISFDHNRFNTNELTTLFTAEDFTEELDLIFEEKNKKVIVSNGKELGSFYLYTYHWKLNPKLKVMFRVHNKFFIEKDDYPRDFFLVSFQLE